jgi:rfaE bifunctional protein nucleotidyltransferase chain/domain
MRSPRQDDPTMDTPRPPASPADPANKLLTLRDALAGTAWKRPLVFTNGVFDVLHAGHVQYLVQARALGASLLVALNTDRSARSLGKGPDRPINTQADRALVVGALAHVDHVMLFDEPTPCELLAQLRPDVYVKGGDYDIESLRETALVRGWGGRSVALPFLAGRSTTSMLERIRGR